MAHEKLVTKKLREMDMEELELRQAELEKEMFDTRQRLVTKEQDNTAQLRLQRRDYARLLTVVNEKKRASS
ncbi:MAG: 50S ribosomal protein L29 [Candidatus Sumerlaeia bacterium]|nr:50S ribosomal protein L29 [Candidatus Sumerlaeia bacterium]